MIFCAIILSVFQDKRYLGDISRIFTAQKAKLVIELDGSQHYESEAMEKDAERTEFLEKYGLKIIRIPNNEINENFDGVCDYIDFAVKQSLSQPDG